jgi:3-methyladenine DNA glycosylase AlkC
MTAENFALKDMFSQESVGALAQALASVYSPFPVERFLDGVFDRNWEGLALKGRVRQITLTLGRLLPADYPHALKILSLALPALQSQGFEKMVFPDFVEVYGLDDWDSSLKALEYFTQHVSAEFAIRPFIERDPQRTLGQMLSWTAHSHPGVRRLASEGCRPRLPWGLRLNSLVADPVPILPILENLKDDPREEIRRSVANNLNDISKDHPDLVLELLAEWQDPEDENRCQLIGHALRSLVKAGHPGALQLLGFSNEPGISVSKIQLEPSRIKLGESTTFSFEILSTSSQEQLLLIDYIVHFLKANGTQSPKVFKLSQRILQAGEKIRIARKHSIAPITTRVYYPGIQSFQPQINGQVFGRVDLELLP